MNDNINSLNDLLHHHFIIVTDQLEFLTTCAPCLSSNCFRWWYDADVSSRSLLFPSYASRLQFHGASPAIREPSRISSNIQRSAVEPRRSSHLASPSLERRQSKEISSSHCLRLKVQATVVDSSGTVLAKPLAHSMSQNRPLIKSPIGAFTNHTCPNRLPTRL